MGAKIVVDGAHGYGSCIIWRANFCGAKFGCGSFYLRIILDLTFYWNRFVCLVYPSDGR